MREPVRDWSGNILGWLETAPNGDVTARNFLGEILGFYRKQQDWTTDFLGNVITRGNAAMSLVLNNAKK